jgi:hypothetical protein
MQVKGAVENAKSRPKSIIRQIDRHLDSKLLCSLSSPRTGTILEMAVVLRQFSCSELAGDLDAVSPSGRSVCSPKLASQIDTELRGLIRRISTENPLWGAPRIHGELLKLGFEIAQSSVAKYMVKLQGTPNQRWRTFLHNHVAEIAAIDLFVVPTIGFELLYAFVVVRLRCR